MIRQLAVTLKTTAATLTYGEMGDVVINSTSAVTIELPAPCWGCWFRISNVGAGVVTVYHNANITILNQTEQALLLANGASSWWMSKGGSGGAVTKEAIEAVLTGVISSHSHELTFKELEDAPSSYVGQAGKVPAVNSGENGLEFIVLPTDGGGAAAFTELEDTPASYDGEQGKFLRVNSTETGLEFTVVPPGSGASSFTDLNDVPSSYIGKAGKVPAVNAGETGLEFIDMPEGDGGVTAVSIWGGL